MSLEEKRNRINEYINTIDSTYDNIDLVEFLDWLNIDEIFENHLQRTYEISDVEKIAAGTKVSKALKYFEPDENVLRTIQDQLSMIIQEDKITGRLCLSVHPLDYLSVSENTHHWRSCHSLDGDYRSGNLQYMVDKSTIVCYLCNDTEQKLPNFPSEVPWNSKKWRMLLFVSDKKNALFAGRQYPFFCPSALDTIKEIFLESLGKRISGWTPWYNDYLKTFPGDNYVADDSWLCDRHICMNGRIYSMNKLIKEPKKPLFFNDLINSSCYIPYYCWNRYSNDYNFTIGDEVPCPCCGGRKMLRVCEDMRCDLCFDDLYTTRQYLYCDCCDRRVFEEEAHVDSQGYIYCQECFEDNVLICEKCENSWNRNYIKYDRKTNQYLCPHCRRIETDYFLPF